jgi:hypothetical protein
MEGASAEKSNRTLESEGCATPLFTSALDIGNDELIESLRHPPKSLT